RCGAGRPATQADERGRIGTSHEPRSQLPPASLPESVHGLVRVSARVRPCRRFAAPAEHEPRYPLRALRALRSTFSLCLRGRTHGCPHHGGGRLGAGHLSDRSRSRMNTFLAQLLTHGLAAVSAASLIERLRVPVPALPALLLAGSLAAEYRLPTVPLVLGSALGFWVGDLVWY